MIHTNVLPSLPPGRLIATMLVVDPVKRASLEQVAAHTWLKNEIPIVCAPQSIPPFSSIDDIPDDMVDMILVRLELGGYGSRNAILR